GRFDPAALDALGRRWRLLDPGIDTKLYPVCLSAHAAIDAVRDVMAEHGLTPLDVRAIRCRVPPVVAANLTYGQPATAGEARFSLPFAAACAMLYGTLALEHLDDAALADPALRQAAGLVSMTADPGWNADPVRARTAPEGAEVSVETRTGERFVRFCASARGTVARPLSAAEHAAKFRTCAARAAGPDEAERLHRKLRRIEAEMELSRLFEPAHHAHRS
ncbi:MmgE/PrpD family protein, partial [Azospirillum sp. 412522]|nr:MmgE/PrpD family protein [Azospirillum sp. 412522]